MEPPYSNGCRFVCMYVSILFIAFSVLYVGLEVKSWYPMYSNFLCFVCAVCVLLCVFCVLYLLFLYLEFLCRDWRSLQSTIHLIILASIASLRRLLPLVDLVKRWSISHFVDVKMRAASWANNYIPAVCKINHVLPFTFTLSVKVLAIFYLQMCYLMLILALKFAKIF